ncbi:MAG: hypothetical protein ABL958_15920 [Bdellovibrionia bacterium]
MKTILLIPILAFFSCGGAHAYDPCANIEDSVCDRASRSAFESLRDQTYVRRSLPLYMKNFNPQQEKVDLRELVGRRYGNPKSYVRYIDQIEDSNEYSLNPVFKKVKKELERQVQNNPGLNKVQKSDMLSKIRKVKLVSAKDLVKDDPEAFANFCGDFGQVMNAYYDPKKNTVQLCPAAWVGRPVEDIVGIVAHEMGHSIDSGDFPYAYEDFLKCTLPYATNRSQRQQHQYIADYWAMQVTGGFNYGPTIVGRSDTFMCEASGRGQILTTNPVYRRMYTCSMDQRTCDLGAPSIRAPASAPEFGSSSPRADALDPISQLKNRHKGSR